MSRDDTAGVVVVDKPAGLTSHDVVQRVRRLLGQRRVGHAGTLDPLATGVLVVMVGPATKLAPFLTSHAKSYRAQIRFGSSTDTLDADGAVVDRTELPAWWLDRGERERRVEEALAAERQRAEQAPPAYSAIKVAGRAAYAHARAGQEVALAPRPVTIHRLELSRGSEDADDGAPARSEPDRLSLTLTVSKGYYVRALARDLGERLALPAHLSALRRTASGPFDLGRAIPLDAGPEGLRAALLPLAAAATLALPRAILSAEGARRAATGQPVAAGHFAAPPEGEGPGAWLDPQGELVAIGELVAAGQGRVLRGFARPGQS